MCPRPIGSLGVRGGVLHKRRKRSRLNEHGVPMQNTGAWPLTPQNQRPKLDDKLAHKGLRNRKRGSWNEEQHERSYASGRPRTQRPPELSFDGNRRAFTRALAVMVRQSSATFQSCGGHLILLAYAECESTLNAFDLNAFVLIALDLEAFTEP